MSRLDATFARLRQENRTGLVTYTTAGDPDLSRSAEVLLAIDRAGADVLEVGVPFTDPLADGPVIQRAAERALKAGATLTATLDLIERMRPSLRAPMVLFTYANPVLRFGASQFARRAAEAGIDGVLVLDLPIEEAGDLHAALTEAGLDTIFLLSPTTSDARIETAALLGRGFLYGIARLGVTGARDEVASGARDLVARIRARARLPVALGFGISRPEHVAEVGRWADAAVVGSALVGVIERSGASADLAAQAAAFVEQLRAGCGRPA